MSEIGLWHAVQGGQPTRLLSESIPTEKDLENWIFEDPTLLASNLHRVRRQVPLGGKFMDLLAIEEPGVWVVCELKKTKLYRDSFTQAIDYVTRLDLLDISELKKLVEIDSSRHTAITRALIEKAIDREINGEERNIRSILVGNEVKEDLKHMVNLLSNKYSFPISVCSFTAVSAPGDDQGIILMRDISEDSSFEIDTPQEAADYKSRIEGVRQYFKDGKQAEIFETLSSVFGTESKFFIRPWKKSIMIAPHQHHGRYLAYFTSGKNGVRAMFGKDAILEFFPDADVSFLDGLDPDIYLTTASQAKDWAEEICKSVEGASATPPPPSEWNGRDWYFAFGNDDNRKWEDALKYGFVSAGGGDWYSKTVRNLPIGARIFVYIPQVGYVGVGETTASAINFLESKEWQGKDLEGKYTHTNGEPEYIVPVKWIATRSPEDAIYGNGFFASQHSTCKLRDAKTLKVLQKEFNLQ
jgi:hypothetical protein